MQKQPRRTVRRLGGSAGAVALAAAFLVIALPTVNQTAGAAEPAPTVTSVSPSSGLLGSEQAPEPTTSVTISGTSLDTATLVFFGTSSAPFKVVSSSEIVATAVGTAAGTVDVTVKTLSGTSGSSSADQFAFITIEKP